MAAPHPSERIPLMQKDREDFISTAFKVKGSDVRGGQVEALIGAPADAVLAVLRDYPNYKGFLPFFSRSEVVGREGDARRMKLRARIMKGAVTINAEVLATETGVEHGGRQFALKKKRGNVKRLDATFTVYAVDAGRSVLVVRMMLDPDIWYVRDSTLSDYNRVNARRIIRAIKKRLGVPDKN